MSQRRLVDISICHLQVSQSVTPDLRRFLLSDGTVVRRWLVSGVVLFFETVSTCNTAALGISTVNSSPGILRNSSRV